VEIKVKKRIGSDEIRKDASSHYEIAVFGRLMLQRGDESVPLDPDLKTDTGRRAKKGRKEIEVLAYLACHKNPVSREKLEVVAGKQPSNFSHHLKEARQALREKVNQFDVRGLGGEAIKLEEGKGGWVRLNENITSAVIEFWRHVDSAEKAQDQSDKIAEIQSLNKAIQCYETARKKGELLEGYEHWNWVGTLRQGLEDKHKKIEGRLSGLRLFPQLLGKYENEIKKKLSRVRLIGSNESKPLDEAFVPLALSEHTRPLVRADWQGLLDAQLREERGLALQAGAPTEETREEARRAVSASELLSRGARALVIGAPGSGKTTLLRSFVQKTTQLPVFLELKSLEDTEFDAANNDLASLLFEKVVAGLLDPDEQEREELRREFLEQLKTGKATIYLDGLDEVRGQNFFGRLCEEIRRFLGKPDYDRNSLIISTRPYEGQDRFEDARGNRIAEYEIAPLNQRQIGQFIECYHGDELLAGRLLNEMRDCPEVREWARVPLLLGFLLVLYKQSNQIPDGRLNLYNALINLLIKELDAEKSSGGKVKRTAARKDFDSSVYRGFLQHLAYHQMFAAQPREDVTRFTFKSADISKRAEEFLGKSYSSGKVKSLADAVKSLPLLREIGPDVYAFTHLTLQEYLAAEMLAGRDDGARILCRGYFHPLLIKLEAAPMALGLMPSPDATCELLESLPESLDFARLRLLARGLCYGADLSAKRRAGLLRRLEDFVTERNDDETPYADLVIRAFSAPDANAQAEIIPSLTKLLKDNNPRARRRAAAALGTVGGKRAVSALSQTLRDEEDPSVRRRAADGLRRIGGERAVGALIAALEDRDPGVRAGVAAALGEVGGKRAIVPLAQVLRDEDHNLGKSAADALALIGDARAADELIRALKEGPPRVRGRAAEALGHIGGAQAIRALEEARQDDNPSVRWRVADALREARNEPAEDAASPAIPSVTHHVQARVAEESGEISGQEPIEVLAQALSDKNRGMRRNAVERLRQIGGEQAAGELIPALRNEDRDTRGRAAAALGEIGGEQAVGALLLALRDKDRNVRWYAARALELLRERRKLNDGLMLALTHKDGFVKRKALEAIGYHAHDDRMLHKLTDLLTNDPDAEVRQAASDAVEKRSRKLALFGRK
jgi:HEAT repeat protein